VTDGLWILAAAFLVSAFTALSREAMAEFSFSDMEELLRKRGRTKRDLPRVERFVERLRDCRYIFRIVDYVSRAVAAVGIWWLCDGLGESWLQWPVFFGGLALLILMLDVLLRPLAGANAELLALWLLGPWTGLYLLLWLPALPFHAGRRWVEHLLRGGEQETPSEQAEDEIMAAVSLSEAIGQIDEQERDMIESVLGLNTITVERLMTPRTDMKAVELGEGVEGVLKMAQESGHSRLPVYEGNRDNIVGICYVKDLLGLDSGKAPELQDMLREPSLVPMSKKVGELLKEFRRNRVHLAVVLDEYGGTSGLITIEDIIEEVFGDIEDEYDEFKDVEVHEHGDSVLDIDARLRVDEVNERFDVNLPESELYESVGGLLTSHYGRIPEVDFAWEGDGVRLSVLEATERRVVKIRLERLDEGEQGRNGQR